MDACFQEVLAMLAAALLNYLHMYTMCILLDRTSTLEIAREQAVLPFKAFQ